MPLTPPTNTKQFLPAQSNLLTGKIINATGVFSLAAGVPTNAITLTLDNSATNASFMILRSLTISNDETATAHTITLGISPDNGTTFIPIGTVNVPAGAGIKTDATIPIVDALNNLSVLGQPSDLGSNRCLTIPNGCLLMAGCPVIVASGKAVQFCGQVDIYN